MVEVDDLVESRPEQIRWTWRMAEALGAAWLLIEIANNPSQLRYARCWAFARLKHRGWLFLFARTNQSGKDIRSMSNRATADVATQVALYRRMALPQAVFATAPAMKLTDVIDMESPRFTFVKPHEKKA